jgi:hypothetical protein
MLGLVLLLWGARAEAQTGLYLQGTASLLQFQNTPFMYGATFGGFRMKNAGPVSLGGDFRGGVTESHNGTSAPLTDEALDFGLLGVRVAASPRMLPLSIKPYAEAMIGFGYWRGGSSVQRQDKNHMLIQFIGGVDVPVSKHFDWRVAEFTFGRAGAQPGSIHPITVSTGIVVRLP